MITVGGSVVGSKMYGGFVFSADFSFGGLQGSSTCRLSIVGTSRGGLSTPSLGGGASINLGFASFKGTMNSYNISREALRETMEIEYIDNSFKYLDTKIVLLRKKYAGGSNVILVGKEYSPCDTEKSSMYGGDLSSFSGPKSDPCDPCPFCPINKYENGCEEDNKDVLHPIFYTFDELIGSFPNSGVSGGSIPISDYRQSYTGDLRGVLSSWCSDLGISYYWDCFSDRVVFVSRDVNLSGGSGNPSLTVVQKGKSLENCSGMLLASSYEKEGSLQSYNCYDDRIVSLAPLYLKDILGENRENVDEGGGGGGLPSVPDSLGVSGLPSVPKSL